MELPLATVNTNAPHALSPRRFWNLVSCHEKDPHEDRSKSPTYESRLPYIVVRALHHYKKYGS